jgi:predicted enzyme related to lactoylglutathione lyase
MINQLKFNKMQVNNSKNYLIGVSVPMSKKTETLSFYSSLLNMEAGRALNDSQEVYHLWGGSGVKLVFTVPDTKDQWEPAMMLNFRVDSLAHYESSLEAMGGKKLAGPFPLTVAKSALESFATSYEDLAYGDSSEVTSNMGTCSIMMDPSGNRIILTQLEPYAERFFEDAQISKHQRLEHKAGLNNATFL